MLRHAQLLLEPGLQCLIRGKLLSAVTTSLSARFRPAALCARAADFPIEIKNIADGFYWARTAAN